VSQQPEKTIVRAIIPSTEHPDIHVTDRTGIYPTEAVEITRNPERVLHEIGKRVLIGTSLSIDRAHRQNVQDYIGGNHNIADLRTKPVNPRTTQLAKGYIWSRI